MTPQEIIAAIICLVIAFALWWYSEPRADRLYRQLHEALCERECLQEMVAECARQGAPLTVGIINDLACCERRIALLERLMEDAK